MVRMSLLKTLQGKRFSSSNFLSRFLSPGHDCLGQQGYTVAGPEFGGFLLLDVKKKKKRSMIRTLMRSIICLCLKRIKLVHKETKEEKRGKKRYKRDANDMRTHFYFSEFRTSQIRLNEKPKLPPEPSFAHHEVANGPLNAV